MKPPAQRASQIGELRLEEVLSLESRQASSLRSAFDPFGKVAHRAATVMERQAALQVTENKSLAVLFVGGEAIPSTKVKGSVACRLLTRAALWEPFTTPSSWSGSLQGRSAPKGAVLDSRASVVAVVTNCALSLPRRYELAR